MAVSRKPIGAQSILPPLHSRSCLPPCPPNAVVCFTIYLTQSQPSYGWNSANGKKKWNSALVCPLKFTIAISYPNVEESEDTVSILGQPTLKTSFSTDLTWSKPIFVTPTLFDKYFQPQKKTIIIQKYLMKKKP